jgi:hypothetical protein
VSYSLMNPTLRDPVLEIIENEGLVSSPAKLVHDIQLKVKELLPPEATASIYTMINHLADEFAIAHGVMGYQLGEGICRDPQKTSK